MVAPPKPAWLLAIGLLLGCGSDDVVDPPPPEPEPPLPTCDAPGIALPDGRCLLPGVPSDACAPGFVHDGVDSCVPQLPDGICPPGLMALPGETACRPVMDCGEGPWGTLPVDDDTVYVDGSYAGAGDGSSIAPFSSIAEAVVAAPDGALVAIAEGEYVESIKIADKSLRLWGRCPDLVTIRSSGAAPGCPVASLCLRDQAHGTEVGGLSLTGSFLGLIMSDALDVLIDRVRVHDTGDEGIRIDSELGPASVTITGVLVERAVSQGIDLNGVDGNIADSVVRELIPDGALAGTAGIRVQPQCLVDLNTFVCDTSKRPRATITRTVVEQTPDFGITVGASDVTLDGVVVRDIALSAAGELGFGVTTNAMCQPFDAPVCDPALRTSIEVTRSHVSRCGRSGLRGDGADLSVADTVIASNLSSAATATGAGIRAVADCKEAGIAQGCDPLARTIATVSRSTIAGNAHHGVDVFGSSVTLDGVMVRDTQYFDGPTSGFGVQVAPSCALTSCDPAARGELTMTNSVVQANVGVAIDVEGSDAVIASSVIRATLPNPITQRNGRGINAQLPCIGPCLDSASTVTVEATLIEDMTEFGITISGAALVMTDSVVRNTAARAIDGFFGDGIVVSAEALTSSLSVSGSWIDGSDRAGIAVFGASAVLSDTRVTCASIDIATESIGGLDATVDNGGNNACGCPGADAECKAISAGLEPPSAVGP